MAKRSSLLTSLKSILPEPTWSWVIPALIHDRLVWDALGDPTFFERAVENIHEPRDWSPGNLSLLTLGYANLDQLPEEVIQEAKSALEIFRQENSSDDIAELNLKFATMIALGLYNELSGSNHRQFGENNVPFLMQSQKWLTSFAILMSWVDNPSLFAQTLLSSGNNSKINSIVIDILMCQPLPQEEFQENIEDLIENIPQAEVEPFLSQLARHKPELVKQLATNWINTHQISNSSLHAFDLGNQIQQLSEDLHAAELFSLAGLDREAQEQRLGSIYQLKNIQDNLINRLVGGVLLDKSTEQSLSLWTQTSTPREQIPPAGLIVKLLQANRLEESKALLPDTERNTQTPLRWLYNLYQALESEDLPQARTFGQQTLNSVIEITDRDLNGLEIQLGSEQDVVIFLTDLIHQLTYLALYKEAFQAAQVLQEFQPNNTKAMMTLCKTARSAGEYETSIASAELAVAHQSSAPEFRRQLAKSLEVSGFWEEALKERKTILEHRFTEPEAGTWPTADDLIALANCSIHADQPNYALDACQKAIDIDPSNGYAHAILGEALSVLGDQERSMEHFQLATQLAPHQASPWLSLSKAFERSGQIEKAIETLRTASHAVPDDPAVFYALGKALVADDSVSQAQSALDRAFQLVSQPKVMLNQRSAKSSHRSDIDLFARNREQLCEIALIYGDILSQLGHKSRANKVFEQAYYAYPAYPGLAYTYAKSLLEEGNERAALAPLAVAVAAKPNVPLPYIQYAKSLMLVKEYPLEAAESLQTALRILESQDNETTDEAREMQELAVALLGQAQEASGDLESALRTYTQALETDLAKELTWKNTLAVGLGRVALQLNQPEVAIAALQDSHRSEIQDSEVAQILCESYSAINLNHEALYAARIAVHLAPDDVKVLAWFADQAKKLGVIAEAVPALTSAAQLDPQRTDLIIQLGQTFVTIGKKDQARTAFRSVLTSPYSNPEDLYLAAESLSDLGDTVSAAECLERALEIHPHPPMSLILELTEAYTAAKKTELAIKTIDKGIHQDSENALLYTTKADLLEKLGHDDAAKACLEHALIVDPQNGEVHYRIAINLRNKGEVFSACRHAFEAVQRLDTGVLACAARGLAAELARSTLQENLIQGLLEQVANPDNESEPNGQGKRPPSLFDYFCIISEFSLDREEQIAAAAALNEAYSIEQDHPRGLGLQGRMALRQGDRESANKSLLSGLEKIGFSTQQENPLGANSNTVLGLALLAIELFKWDLALELIDKAVSISPSDSYLLLQKSRLFVLRAEFQHLCQSLEIVNHAPGAVALSPRTQRIFEETIHNTVKSLNDDQRVQIPTSIMRWRKRGEMAFNPSREAIDGIEDLLTEPSDQAALLIALSQSRDINAVAKLYHNLQSKADSEILHHSIYAAYAVALIECGDDLTSKEHAFESIKSAIDQYPTEPIYYKVQAKIAELRGDLVASQKALQTALTLWSDEPLWQSALGHISLLNDDYDLALTHFENAIAIEPNNHQHYLDLSQAYLLKGDGDEAIATLKQASNVAPHQVEVLLALASAQYQNRNYSQALKSTKYAAEIAPDLPDPLLLSAKIALKMDDPGNAKAYVESVLRISPNDPEALHLQAKSLMSSGDPSKALEIVEKAIPLSSDPLPLLLQRAELLGNFEGPEANLLELKRISIEYPDEPSVLTPLANALAKAGQQAEAIQAAQQALKRGSGQLNLDDQASLHHLLGLLLRQSGQLDQSIQQLSEAIRIAPNRVGTYLELGLTHEDRREHNLALETYQKAIAKYPNDPRPYYQAGLLLKASRDYPAAEKMLRRAAEKAPNDVAIHRQLAALVALNLVHNRQEISSDV